MFRFQHIEHLTTLVIIPVLIALFAFALYTRRKRLQQIGNERLVLDQLVGFIAGRNTLKFVLVISALALIIVGWANPQTADKSQNVQRKGVDVVIALDVSKSMLATDVQPDRLTRAKQLIMSLSDKLQNDRIALIIFAGRSYLQVPLTVDNNMLKMMVQNVSPDMVPTQGTVIGDAIDMANESFSPAERKYKSLIIISDGEDHDDQAIEKTRTAADAGVIVHTVGIGSPMGSTIMDPTTRAMKLDDAGNPVISKLNEGELKSIAAAGHGYYQFLQDPEDVASKLAGNLNSMEQKNLGAAVYTDFDSYFQLFLLAGIILILAEWMLPGATTKLKRNGATA